MRYIGATMVSLESYHEQVREAILLRSGAPVMNSNIDHATIITQEALANAKSKVRILSSKLDPTCYAHPGVIEAARYFLLDPDHRLEILIEAEEIDDNRNFDWHGHKLIREFKGKNAEVRLVPKAESARYSFNFMLLDDYGFRYEFDRRRPAAVAGFLPAGAPNAQVENLSSVFSELWAASIPLKLN